MNPIEVKDDAIVQEVEIRCGAERIFAALTNPAELTQWWGLEGKFQATHVECDLRLGGKWRMEVRGSGGRTLTVSGEYRAIERPRLLIFTWVREQEDATETLVRWDLEEHGATTRVRVTHSGLITEALRTRNDGWALIVKLLRVYIEEGK